MFNPKEDGLTHINIYSKGITPLGRLLSNFAFTPFVSAHGRFCSMEGYWFYLQSEPSWERESLRLLSGHRAKEVGQRIRTKYLEDDIDFKKAIITAMYCKLIDNDSIVKMLQKSTLPFTHYYSYGNTPVDAGFKWQLGAWENIRNELRDKNWRSFFDAILAEDDSSSRLQL